MGRRYMIEISISTLISCTKALNTLIQKPLKVATAYKIARLVREIQHELDLFNNVKRALIEKYAKKDENNNIIFNDNNEYEIIAGKEKQYNEELQNILNQTIQLNAEPILLSELEEERFTPQDIESIFDFIKK